MATNNQQSHSILRHQQVQARTGLSRSTIYAYVAKGTFPAPVSLSARTVGWIEAEIDAWLATRIENSRKAASGAAMKKNSPTPKSQPAKRKARFINNTLEAQRARLMDLLKIAPRTTTELRNQHGIMSPATRVFELRKQGHNIPLDWIEQHDAAGIKHRAGRYRLIKEVGHEHIA